MTRMVRYQLQEMLKLLQFPRYLQCPELDRILKLLHLQLWWKLLELRWQHGRRLRKKLKLLLSQKLLKLSKLQLLCL